MGNLATWSRGKKVDKEVTKRKTKIDVSKIADPLKSIRNNKVNLDMSEKRNKVRSDKVDENVIGQRTRGELN